MPCGLRCLACPPPPRVVLAQRGPHRQYTLEKSHFRPPWCQEVRCDTTNPQTTTLQGSKMPFLHCLHIAPRGGGVTCIERCLITLPSTTSSELAAGGATKSLCGILRGVLFGVANNRRPWNTFSTLTPNFTPRNNSVPSWKPHHKEVSSWRRSGQGLCRQLCSPVHVREADDIGRGPGVGTTAISFHWPGQHPGQDWGDKEESGAAIPTKKLMTGQGGYAIRNFKKMNKMKCKERVSKHSKKMQ